MIKKYIIAVVAEDKSGKTSVLNNLWDLLPSYHSNDKIIITHKSHEIIGYCSSFADDRKAIQRDNIIGINSLGDNIEEIRRGFVELLYAADCSIIVCTAHTINDLLEARDTLCATTITDQMKKRGITGIFLPKAQSKINEFDILVTRHIQNYYDPKLRKSIKTKFNDPTNKKPIKIEEFVENVNITRLSAFHILDLVERLIN